MKKYTFDHLDDRRFVPRIAKTFQLEQTVEAYRNLESNRQIGGVAVAVNLHPQSG